MPLTHTDANSYHDPSFLLHARYVAAESRPVYRKLSVIVSETANTYSRELLVTWFRFPKIAHNKDNFSLHHPCIIILSIRNNVCLPAVALILDYPAYSPVPHTCEDGYTSLLWLSVLLWQCEAAVNPTGSQPQWAQLIQVYRCFTSPKQCSAAKAYQWIWPSSCVLVLKLEVAKWIDYLEWVFNKTNLISISSCEDLQALTADLIFFLTV